jgi:hypothetical protein
LEAGPGRWERIGLPIMAVAGLVLVVDVVIGWVS